MKFKSRIIASSTAAIMLCTGSAAFAEGKSYSDVGEQSPYYDAIMYMTDTEVFTGVSLQLYPKVVQQPLGFRNDGVILRERK